LSLFSRLISDCSTSSREIYTARAETCRGTSPVRSPRVVAITASHHSQQHRWGDSGIDDLSAQLFVVPRFLNVPEG
jgi:hypothetical protein